MKTQELIIEKSQCCGCGACENVCPKNAIKMEKDNYGCYFPVIDENKCIDCKLCLKVCDFKNFNSKKVENTFYSCRNKDVKEVMKSRSGGFFYTLANNILMHNGIVYGVELNENLIVEHARIDKLTELNKIRGVKYVKSDVTKIFEQVVKDLKNNKTVLFSGTPCETHGLLSLCSIKKINTNNLVTIDVVCHGACQPMLFDLYKDFVVKKFKKEINGFEFRDKKHFGWNSHYESIYFDNGRRVSLRSYTESFYSSYFLMESCFKCPYTTVNQKVDFTIGDFWGINEIDQRYKDNKGVSLVICHNDRARLIFDEIKDQLIFSKTEDKQSIAKNYPLYEKTNKPVNYERYINEFQLKKNDEKEEIFEYKSFKLFVNKIKNKIKNIVR
jgi:coenzyme F420-reducing hydrogenase beta subunit